MRVERVNEGGVAEGGEVEGRGGGEGDEESAGTDKLKLDVEV